MPASREKQAAVAERRAKAIELRLEGLSVPEIADKLGYSGRSDKARQDRVWQDISRALEQRRRRLDQVAGDLTLMHEMRLERLLEAVWARALSGEVPAVYAAVRILERQARLRGLDAPLAGRAPVTGEEDAEIATLVEEFTNLVEGRLEPPAPDVVAQDVAPPAPAP